MDPFQGKTSVRGDYKFTHLQLDDEQSHPSPAKLLQTGTILLPQVMKILMNLCPSFQGRYGIFPDIYRADGNAVVANSGCLLVACGKDGIISIHSALDQPRSINPDPIVNTSVVSFGYVGSLLSLEVDQPGKLYLGCANDRDAKEIAGEMNQWNAGEQATSDVNTSIATNLKRSGSTKTEPSSNHKKIRAGSGSDQQDSMDVDSAGESSEMDLDPPGGSSSTSSGRIGGAGSAAAGSSKGPGARGEKDFSFSLPTEIVLGWVKPPRGSLIWVANFASVAKIKCVEVKSSNSFADLSKQACNVIVLNAADVEKVTPFGLAAALAVGKSSESCVLVDQDFVETLTKELGRLSQSERPDALRSRLQGANCFSELRPIFTSSLLLSDIRIFPSAKVLRAFGSQYLGLKILLQQLNVKISKTAASDGNAGAILLNADDSDGSDRYSSGEPVLTCLVLYRGLVFGRFRS